MIKVYDSDEKLFNNNGIKVLNPIKCEVYKEDNGDYYIELEDKIDNIDYYQANMIITCPTPFPEGVQAFRLMNPERGKSKLSVKAKHVYFDTSNYIIEDSYIVDKNCGYALDHLNSNCDVKTPFNTSSDITTNNTYRCVRTSLEEAISVIIDRWGGHLVRNNFEISVNSKIGSDRGVVLKHGKNITDIKSNEDWSNVCTKILPVGKDGLLLPEKYITIDEEIYKIPFTKVVSFTQDLSEEDYASTELYNEALLQDLRNQAVSFLNENKFPKVNYTLSAHLDKITDVGDTIYVKHQKLKMDLITNVISVKWDVISKKYKNIEFGNFKNSLKDLIKNVNNSTSQIAKEISENTKIILEQELKEATSKILGMMGNSYVIYDGDKILVVDKLPKEEATNVMVINSGGIGFSTTGINGTFNSAWTIDGTLDMKNINVINLIADMIKGGTLKLGGENNTNGSLEIYNQNSELIGKIDNNGLQLKFGNNLNTLESQFSNVKNEINDSIKNNYYDKSTINDLVISSTEGITNTFSEAGGNNIFRNTGLWFKNDGEDSKKDKTIIGSNIKLFDALDETVNNVRINGYTRQITTTGQQLYNYKDTSKVVGVTVDEEGWITATYDNTSGTSTRYLNYYTNNLDLKNNTNYLIVAEIKDVSGTGWFAPVTILAPNEGQFSKELSIPLEDLSDNMYTGIIKTKENIENTIYGLRSFISFRAGQSGSITFRLSVLEDTTITEDNFVYEPYTGGKPSPSPDYPQEIEVAKGNNLFYVEPKTLNGVSLSYSNDGAIVLNGTATGDCFFRTKLNNPIETESTLSYKINSLINTVIIRTRNAQNVIQKELNTSVNLTNKLTKTSDDEQAEICVVNGTELNNYKIYVQLEKGSIANEYEPYNSIVAKSTEENLFDKDNAKTLYNSGGNTVERIEGGIKIKATGTSAFRFAVFDIGAYSEFIGKKISVGTNFNATIEGTSQFSIGYLDSSGNNRNILLSKTDSGSITREIPTIENASDMRLGLWLYVSTNDSIPLGYEIEYKDIIINIGEPLDYKPYQESKQTYSLNDNFIAEQDYIQDNKLYKNVAKVVLDGSENWEISSFTNDTILSVFLDVQNMKNSSEFKMNRFKYIPKVFNDTDYEYCATGGGSIRIGLYKSRLQSADIAGFKQWLSENPVEIYYQLETPTTVELEPSGELKTFDGTTYMSNNVGTDMEVNYKAIYSLYEYWIGKATRKTNEKAVNSNSIVIQKGSFIQEQEVPDGIYSICFKYKKLIQLAKTKVKINDFEYDLSSLEDKEFYTGEKDNETGEYITQPLEVSSRHINIEFISDTNNAIEIYDLMCNKGNVKLAYSQNQNETTTDTVNISKGITITSSNIDVVFRANADGIRLYTLQGEVKTRFTDKGMSTKEAIIEDEAQICGTLIQEIDDQTWWTRM